MEIRNPPVQPMPGPSPGSPQEVEFEAKAGRRRVAAAIHLSGRSVRRRTAETTDLRVKFNLPGRSAGLLGGPRSSFEDRDLPEPGRAEEAPPEAGIREDRLHLRGRVDVEPRPLPEQAVRGVEDPSAEADPAGVARVDQTVAEARPADRARDQLLHVGVAADDP